MDDQHGLPYTRRISCVTKYKGYNLPLTYYLQYHLTQYLYNLYGPKIYPDLTYDLQLHPA